MNKRIIKKIINPLFLIATFALTIWYIFHDEDLGELICLLGSSNAYCYIPAILCVIGFILSESVIIHYMLRTLSIRVPFPHCCLYSFIGFFYSSITPSASGGQPMQIMGMRKDGIPVAVSSVILAIVTITYKLVLALIGLTIVIWQPAAIMRHLDPVMGVIYLGLALNVICIVILLLLVFHPELARFLAQKILLLLKKLRLVRNLEKQQNRLDRVLSQYQDAAQYYRSHQMVILRVFLITLVQRILLFLITWFVYLSFSLSGHSVSLIATLQAMISVAADMLPLPGGIGISESLFLSIFPGIFGEDLLLPAMVLSRGISFYTQLLLCATMTIIASFILGKKRKKGLNRL